MPTASPSGRPWRPLTLISCESRSSGKYVTWLNTLALCLFAGRSQAARCGRSPCHLLGHCTGNRPWAGHRNRQAPQESCRSAVHASGQHCTAAQELPKIEKTFENGGTLRFYGQINKGVLSYDDGQETESYGLIDNDNSNTRFGLTYTQDVRRAVDLSRHDRDRLRAILDQQHQHSAAVAAFVGL